MAVNFITENPVTRGWDQQQARSDAAVASDLRRVQAGDAVEQSRQRRDEAQAMGAVLNGLPPDANTIETMRQLARDPNVTPATRLNLFHGIAQAEQAQAAAARAAASQQSLEEYRRERIRQGDVAENRRGSAPGRMVPVAGPNGTTVYVPERDAAGQPVGPRPTAQGPQDPNQYPGNSPDAHDMNILLRGQRDEAFRNSPEYHAAYGRQSRPRWEWVPSDPSNPASPPTLTMITRPPQGVLPPSSQAPSGEGAPAQPPAGAAPPGAPAAPPAAPADPGSAGPAVPPSRPGGVTAAPAPPTVTPIPNTTRVNPTTAEHLRRFTMESGKVIDALDNFERLASAADETTRLSALVANPMDPRAVALRQAYQNVVMALRAEPFANTGVLQPAELQMLDRMLANPETLRGALMTPEARSAQLNQLRQLIRSGLERQRQSITNPTGVQQPAAPTSPPASPSTAPGYHIENGRLVPNQRSDAGGPEQVAQAPVARALGGNGMAEAGQDVLDQRRIDGLWNGGGVMTDQSGQPVTPGTRDNPAVLPNGAPPATGPASDFGDGMGPGDRAQVPEPYRTRGMIRDDYGRDVVPGQAQTDGGRTPDGWRPPSEYSIPGASPPRGAQPAAGGPPMPAGAQPPGSPQVAIPPRNQQALYGPRYVDTLFAQEGNGVNPRSSAAGYGQFLEGTWLGRPDAPGIVARLGAGDPNVQALLRQAWAGDPAARQQLLALRNDPQVARAAVGEYVRQTAATFRNAGIPVDDTNLALAHFFGPAGATRFLRALQADPSTPITRIVPPAVLRANPEVLMPGGQPITAGALYAQYARRYGGGAALPQASDPSMGSNPDQNPGIAPLAVPPMAQQPEPAMPSLGEMPPAPGPGAPPAAAPIATAPIAAPPTPQAATEDAPAPLAGLRDVGRAGSARPGDSANPDQAQGDASLAPPNGSSAASPVSSDRREPTAQERLAAELRGVVGRMPTAGTPPGPFALSDPATLREARQRFIDSGRLSEWNAGVTSFLEDRFARAMEQAGTPHEFQRAVFASPRDRALMMATLTPEQQGAFRDLMRVTDLASRSGVQGPIAQLAQGIYSGRGAGTLARLITDPETVAQLRMLNQIAPDSPRALQIVNAILARTAAPAEAPPMAGPARMPRYRVQGGQLVPVTE